MCSASVPTGVDPLDQLGHVGVDIVMRDLAGSSGFVTVAAIFQQDGSNIGLRAPIDDRLAHREREPVIVGIRLQGDRNIAFGIERVDREPAAGVIAVFLAQIDHDDAAGNFRP